MPLIVAASAILKGLGHDELDDIVDVAIEGKPHVRARSLAQKADLLLRLAISDINSEKSDGIDRLVVGNALQLVSRLDKLPNLTRQERDAFLIEVAAAERDGYLKSKTVIQEPAKARLKKPPLPPQSSQATPPVRQKRRKLRSAAAMTEFIEEAQEPPQDIGPTDAEGPQNSDAVARSQTNGAPSTEQQAKKPGGSGNTAARGPAPAKGETPLARLRSIETTLARIEKNIAALSDTVEVLQLEIRGAGMGGNNPPDQLPIAAVGADLIAEARDSAELLQEEIHFETPRPRVLRVSSRVLERVASGFVQFADWVGNKGDLFLDRFLEAAGTKAGKSVVTVVALKVLLSELNLDLLHVVETVQHFLASLH